MQYGEQTGDVGVCKFLSKLSRLGEDMSSMSCSRLLLQLLYTKTSPVYTSKISLVILVRTFITTQKRANTIALSGIAKYK